MAVMDIEEIFRVLPHRYPLLLVDKITECDFEKRIVGVKNLTINEPQFVGHFPGIPIMPGVLQLEALAQTAGILLNKVSGNEGKIALFTSIDKVKFRRKVVPGDVMYMEVEILRKRTNFAKVTGKITIDGELATEGELCFAFMD